MLWLAAIFAAGIALFSSFMIAGWTLAIGCVLFAAGSLVVRRGGVATALVSAAFLFAGGFAYHAEIAAIKTDRIRVIYDSGSIRSGEPVEITGSISDELENGFDGNYIRLDVESISSGGRSRVASGKVRLFAPITTFEMAEDYRRLELRAGKRVRVTCRLEREDRFRNPGSLSRIATIDQQGLDATCVLKSPLLVEVLGNATPSLTAPLFQVRSWLIVRFRQLFSPQVSGVMIASLLGNKQFLDKETAEVFREGGTFHILVISGLHITFIGGLAALLIGTFTRKRWVQFAGACGFLWLYTIAVGADVPVVRASLMFTVLWFSYVIHRAGSLANALGVCGVLLLAWRPSDLFTPSFQLTFVSVSAIVLAGFPLLKKLRAIGEWRPTSADPFPPIVPVWLERFCQTIYWDPMRWQIESKRNVWSANLVKSPYLKLRRNVQKCVAYIFEGLLISIIVQIGMLPLIVHYFHRVTPISVLMNLWSGVLIALESFTSLFAILFSLISTPLALPLIYLTEMLQWLLVAVPAPLLDLGWSSFRVPIFAQYESWLYAGYLLSVTVLALSVFAWDPFSLSARSRTGRWHWLPFAAAVVLGAMIVFHPFSQPDGDGSLHVDFLDVGQGDSIFITFPNGETMLVDGGGRPSYGDEDEPFEPDVPSIGEAVVSNFLWENGYSSIDYIVATHADADHVQGLADVACNFTVSKAFFGDPLNDAPQQLRLRSILEQRRVPVDQLSRGDRFEIGGAIVEILNRSREAIGWKRENDRSVVIRLTYGLRSFLLTGDIEEAAEADIANGQIHADVLKVPHHGSRTSSSKIFVEGVRPNFAIISVGRRSQFGHPDPEVVERWKAVGAEVLTTGNEGTISFRTDGQQLTFGSFASKRETQKGQ